jgi:aprataxin
MSSSKKPKPTTAEPLPKPAVRGFNARDGLGVYIAHPETNPEGLVVEYDDDFVVIADKFPKARQAQPSATDHIPGLRRQQR